MNMPSPSPDTVTAQPPDSLWWSIALRGVLAIVFGIVALMHPGATTAAFIVVFGVWALADGICALVAAIRRGHLGRSWAWFLLEGIAGIAAGVVAFLYPGVTLFALVLVVGLRAIALGVLELGGAFASEAELSRSRWLYALTGIVSILFGALLLWQPLVGAFALVWSIGVYAIVFGAMTLAFGLHVHGFPHFATWRRPIAASH